MIRIKNTQRKIVVNTASVHHDIDGILHILRYDNFDIGILITNNQRIRKYNRVYRGNDKPTDILSFPFYPEIKAGQRIEPTRDEEKALGDLIISAEYVDAEAKKYKTTFDMRLRILLIHGICHLLGYDHIYDQDYRRMRAKEAFILKKLQQ